MKGTLLIYAYITKNDFEFKKPIVGFNSLNIKVWQQVLIEVDFIKGSKAQTIDEIFAESAEHLYKSYGKANVKIKEYGEKGKTEKTLVV